MGCESIAGWAAQTSRRELSGHATARPKAQIGRRSRIIGLLKNPPPWHEYKENYADFIGLSSHLDGRTPADGPGLFFCANNDLSGAQKDSPPPMDQKR